MKLELTQTTPENGLLTMSVTTEEDAQSLTELASELRDANIRYSGAAFLNKFVRLTLCVSTRPSKGD